MCVYLTNTKCVERFTQPHPCEVKGVIGLDRAQLTARGMGRNQKRNSFRACVRFPRPTPCATCIRLAPIPYHSKSNRQKLLVVILNLHPQRLRAGKERGAKSEVEWIGSEKARGRQWEGGKGGSLSFMFPLPGVPCALPLFTLPSPSLLTSTKAASAERDSEPWNALSSEVSLSAALHISILAEWYGT